MKFACAMAIHHPAAMDNLKRIIHHWKKWYCSFIPTLRMEQSYETAAEYAKEIHKKAWRICFQIQISFLHFIKTKHILMRWVKACVLTCSRWISIAGAQLSRHTGAAYQTACTGTHDAFARSLLWQMQLRRKYATATRWSLLHNC